MVTSIPDVIPPPKPGPLEPVDEVKYKENFIKKFLLIFEDPITY